MKTKAPLRLFKLPTLAIVIACGLAGQPAQAGSYVLMLQQVGSNVVATGSGAIDLTGLSGPTFGVAIDALIPNPAQIVTGPTGVVFADSYVGSITGPTNFGSGAGGGAPNSGSGNTVGFNSFIMGSTNRSVFVPHGYVSDSPLSSSATWNGRTFGSLGVTPGTYVWTWGTSADQSFTLEIGTAVPEPDAGLLFLVATALFAARFGWRQLA
jgi:hypothetical protein